MKFQVKRAELLHAVTVCAAVIKRGDRRKPSLRLCLEISNYGLTVQGNNGSKVSSFQLGLSNGEKIEPTCVTVDECKLLQALKVTCGDDVDLEVKPHAVNVCGKNNRKQDLVVSLRVLESLEEMPEPTLAGAATHELQVSREGLIKGLSAVRFCCDCESTRYSLSAVSLLVASGSNQMEFAATDIRRLAVSRRDCIVGQKATQPLHLLLNCYLVDQLLLVLRASDVDTLTIHAHGERSFHIVIGTCELSDFCVEGRYPRYQEVYPKTHEKHSIFHVADLRAAIAACRVTTSNDQPGLLCSLESDGLAISSRCPDVGETRTKVSSLLVGTPPKYSFLLNHRFLDQFLSKLPKSGMIELHTPQKDNEAFHLKAEGYIDYILMPLDKEGYEGVAA